MCLAIPMQVITVDRSQAICEARGARRTVSLFLLGTEAVKPGDWVAVDRGFALEVLDAARAADAWALMDEMLAAQDTAAEAYGLTRADGTRAPMRGRGVAAAD